MGVLSSILGLGEKVMGKVWPDKAASRDAQSKTNDAEISGGPASRLRLWRGFLGWVLTLTFAWEVVARPVISTYFPDTTLPPSVLGEISHILLGMLGLGF